jgi:hypothetical protein
LFHLFLIKCFRCILVENIYKLNFSIIKIRIECFTCCLDLVMFKKMFFCLFLSYFNLNFDTG